MILFRIIRNLIRLALNLLWLPISIVTRNLFTIIILIGIIAFFVMLNNDNSSTIQQEQMTIPAGAVKPGTSMSKTPAPTPIEKGAPPIAIDRVQKIENGNSSFAQDLLKMMNDSERAYYSQIFYWAMNNAGTGKAVSWNNLNTYGTITPQAIFLNNKGEACRNFTEVLKVKDIKQNIKGIACQRGGGAWCKLGPNATPGCGLGQQPSLWKDIKRSVGF